MQIILDFLCIRSFVFRLFVLKSGLTVRRHFLRSLEPHDFRFQHHSCVHQSAAFIFRPRYVRQDASISISAHLDSLDALYLR